MAEGGRQWSSTRNRCSSHRQLPDHATEVYVAGSAPPQFCELHTVVTACFLRRAPSFPTFFGGQAEGAANGWKRPPGVPYDPNRPPKCLTARVPPAGRSFRQPEEKKKNALHKIFGIFGGKKKDPDKAKPKPEKGDPP